MTTATGRSATARRAPWTLWVGSLIVLANALYLALWYWPGTVPLDVTSGVWSALARDVADGLLYRPLVSDAGYGGTRYMPIFFVAHGLLIRSGLDPVIAGLVLTVVSVVVFDAGLYYALRQLGVRPAIAAPWSVLAHATVSVQLLTLEVKCDLLASGFNLWGLALALRYARSARPAACAGSIGAFAAAIFTKFTTVSGAIAALALWRGRPGRGAAWMAGSGLAATLAALAAATYAASSGRVWSAFTSVASGGATPGYGLRFPWWFAWAVIQDPLLLIIVVTAAIYATRATRMRGLDFPVGYFWLTLAVTAPIFASPGTDNNHLIDLLAASLLLLGHRMEHEPDRPRLVLALPTLLAALTAATWLPGVIAPRSSIERQGRPERSKIVAILARVGSPDRLLSENPIIPILAGHRPVVSDPFSLRILAASRPEVRADFERRLTREVDLVVLVDYSGASANEVRASLRTRDDRGVRSFYGGVHFPAGFLDLLDRWFVVTAVEHPFVVFERRGDQAPEPSAPPPTSPAPPGR